MSKLGQKLLIIKLAYVAILGSLIVIISIGAFWQFSLKPYLEKPMNPNIAVSFYDFKIGSSLTTIINHLVDKNLLSRPKYLLLYARLTNRTRNLHSGIYKIDPKQSPLSFLKAMEVGDVAAFHLRTNEGNTFKQMLIGIALEPRLKHTLDNPTPEEVMIEIGHAGKPYEGYFFPDTYNIPYKMTDVDFLKKAYDTMVQILDEEWKNRDPNIILNNAHELLTLASIIEKETSDRSERFKISSVFHNRLIKNMRLQTDPTVIYGMGDQYRGNIRKKDLLTKTPFNTYRVKGLPPTPISIPSRASINAAAHPVKTNLLYFVSKGDGTHYFSTNYTDHRKAVRKYQIN